MNRYQVPGCLDLAALAALTGDDARLSHFRLLTREQQASAIRAMSADGRSDYAISSATQLAVEQVRAILGPRKSHDPSQVHTGRTE